MKKINAPAIDKGMVINERELISFSDVENQRNGDFLNRVLVFKDDGLGTSQSQYSSALLKSLIRETSLSPLLPKVIILMNRGVLLAINSSFLLADLRLLESKGVLILSNCSCLETHKALDQLAVGGVTTMGNIIEIMNLAKSVVVF